MVAAAPPADMDRSPLWINDTTIVVRAIDALIDSGVIDALADNPSDSNAVAASLGLHARPLFLALDVASKTGLVLTHGNNGVWHVDRGVLATILGPEAVTRALRGELTNDVSEPQGSQRCYPDMVGHIGRIALNASPQIVPSLRRPGQRVVEIAAGASPWGRALCHDDPATTVTAIDLAGVIDATREAVAAEGFIDRYRFVAGDVFEIDGVDKADLVLVASFSRLLGVEQNRALYQRTASWCAPGGRLAVIDAVSTPETRAAGLSSYELGLATRTSRGRCWSLNDYANWLSDAGFAHFDFITTDRPEISLVTADLVDAQDAVDNAHSERRRSR